MKFLEDISNRRSSSKIYFFPQYSQISVIRTSIIRNYWIIWRRRTVPTFFSIIYCLRIKKKCEYPQLGTQKMKMMESLFKSWKWDESWNAAIYCNVLTDVTFVFWHKTFITHYLHIFLYTVKHADAATSIKRDPPLSGHFRAPQTILKANAPLLSVHLSNVASCQRNSPQNTKIVSSNSQFYASMRPVSIKFHRSTFLHRSYARCN